MPGKYLEETPSVLWWKVCGLWNNTVLVANSHQQLVIMGNLLYQASRSYKTVITFLLHKSVVCLEIHTSTHTQFRYFLFLFVGWLFL